MRSTAIVTSLGLVASWGFASLPLVSAQQKCFPLEANTLCGSDFIGYPVQMPSSQFDTALQAMAANSQALARSLQTDSGCTAAGNKTLAAVDTLRYQISMWCAGAVIDAIEVAKCQPTATAQRSKDPTILCSEQCNLAVSTMSNLLNNPDVCPPPTNANLTKSRSDRISLFSNYCSTVGKKDQSKCIIGVATEAKSCGFTTSSVAREQCQALTKDDCCNQLMGRKVADDGNNSILAPALGTATAIVVLVAVFITCCVCRRKRNRRNKNSASNRDTWPYNTQKPWENKEAGIYNNMNRPGDMHSKAPSPDFRDSWTPRGNFETQIDIKPPHSTYQSDNISMSPITTSTYTSQPSPVYHQEPLQPVSASQNVQVDFAAAPTHSPSSRPWDAPVVTAQPAQDQSPVESNEEGEILNIPMRVIHPYVPSLADELPLEAGTEIIMVRSFDDGWALGLIPSTGQQGAFPLVCVVRPEETSNDNMGVETTLNLPEPTDGLAFSKRVSSQQFSKVDLSRFGTLDRSLGRPKPERDNLPAPIDTVKPDPNPITPMPHESFGQPAPEANFTIGTFDEEEEKQSLPMKAPPRVVKPPSPDSKIPQSPDDANPFTGPFDDKHIIEAAFDSPKAPTATTSVTTTDLLPNVQGGSPTLSLAPSLPELRLSTVDLSLSLDGMKAEVVSPGEDDKDDNPFRMGGD